MTEQTILQRCMRVFYRVRAAHFALAGAVCDEVSRTGNISDSDIEYGEQLIGAAGDVVNTLLDIVADVCEEKPEEMPLPFESLEAMDDDGVLEWLCAKVEAKVGKDEK